MAPIYMRATCCNGSGRIFIKSLSALSAFHDVAAAAFNLPSILQETQEGVTASRLLAPVSP